MYHAVLEHRASLVLQGLLMNQWLQRSHHAQQFLDYQAFQQFHLVQLLQHFQYLLLDQEILQVLLDQVDLQFQVGQGLLLSLDYQVFQDFHYFPAVLAVQMAQDFQQFQCPR